MFIKSWPNSNVTTSHVGVPDQANIDRIKGKAIKAHNEEVEAYKRIFTPALLLFFCGITKCVCKPWDLKRVSVNSLVDSSPAGSSEAEAGKGETETETEINSLHEYVAAATQHFEARGGSGDGGGDGDDNTCKVEEIWKPYNLCVDLAPPYSGRLSCLKHLVVRLPADGALIGW